MGHSIEIATSREPRIWSLSEPDILLKKAGGPAQFYKQTQWQRKTFPHMLGRLLKNNVKH